MALSATPRPDVLDRLSAGIAELTTTAAWQAWLDVQRRFHRYSFGNCVLIAVQRPDATHVAGFRRWQEMGRQVRRGEKAIRILAPVTRRVVGEPGEDTVERLVAFRGASIFDLAQTDGRELPVAPVTRLLGDAPAEVWSALAAYATSLGFTVERISLGGNRNGDTNFTARRIRVGDGLSPAQSVKTLAHEIAHAMLHGNVDISRDQAELEAESVAYVVCDSIGVDSSAYSFGYVATWAGGEDAVERIREAGGRISRAARQILTAFGGDAA